MRISDWSSDVCSSDLVCHEGPYISSSRPKPEERKPLSENLGERVERRDKALLGVVAKVLGVADRRQNAGMVAAQIGEHRLFVARHVGRRDIVEIAVGAREDRRGLLFERPRLELRLLEALRQARAAVETLLRRRLEIRAELRPGLHLGKRE